MEINQLELTRKDCRMCGRTKPIEDFRVTRNATIKSRNTVNKGVPTRDTICRECESFNGKFYRMHKKIEQGKELATKEQELYDRMLNVYKALKDKRPGCRLPNVVKELLAIETQDSLMAFESLVESMEQEVAVTHEPEIITDIEHCDKLLVYLNGLSADAPLGYLQSLLSDAQDWDTSDWTEEYSQAIAQQAKRLTTLGNAVYDNNPTIGQAILDIADEIEYL